MSFNSKPIKPISYPSDRPYKVYTFKFSQFGTNDPEVVVHENTIGNIVWTRSSAGTYIGTLANAFPAEKTYFTCLDSTFSLYLYINEAIDSFTVERSSDNTVPIDLSNSLDLDDKFSSVPFEIRVYP
jgi:hypothetical protein